MTTNQKHLDKLDRMLPDVEKAIRARAKHILNSGAIDPEQYKGSEFVLSKILLLDGLNYVISQYEPALQSRKDQINQELSNLKLF